MARHPPRHLHRPTRPLQTLPPDQTNLQILVPRHRRPVRQHDRVHALGTTTLDASCILSGDGTNL